MLDLAVRKGTAISLHQQLVTQLAMQIAAGTLPAGMKLPSVRALSKKLGIHYNTCLAAYQELARLGLIAIRQGSGVTVRPLAERPRDGGDLASLELDQMARLFLEQVKRRGYRREEVVTALERAWHDVRNGRFDRVVYADLHPDILPLFQAELAEALPLPVEAWSLAEMDAAAWDARTAYVTSRYHVHTLQAAMAGASAFDPGQVFVIDVSSGEQERAFVKSLPDGAFVLVVSQSDIVLRQAEAVISALRGDSLLLRAMAWGEGPAEIRAATRHARLIIADSCCAPRLQELTTRPVHTLRVIPEREIEKIRSFCTTPLETSP